jgi:hypothetical protein
VTERDNQPRLFGERDEFSRRNEPTSRVLPAYQGLEVLDLTGRQADDWLILQEQRVQRFEADLSAPAERLGPQHHLLQRRGLQAAEMLPPGDAATDKLGVLQPGAQGGVGRLLTAVPFA